MKEVEWGGGGGRSMEVMEEWTPALGDEEHCGQVDHDVGGHHTQPHEQLVLGVLQPPAGVQGCPAGINETGHVAQGQAVVGREGRVVEAPVQQVVVRGPLVPLLQGQAGGHLHPVPG